jgi:hypothetical protein
MMMMMMINGVHDDDCVDDVDDLMIDGDEMMLSMRW